MRRVAYTAFYTLVFLLGVIFTLLNQDSVKINFHLSQFELPLAVIIIIAIMLGVVLSVIVCYGSTLKHRVEIRGLRKKISLLEQEIQNLRKMPLKGPP